VSFPCSVAGIATLAGIGARVLTSRGDDLTDSDDEMRVAMRQIAGVFSQLKKTRLVKKLAAAPLAPTCGWPQGGRSERLCRRWRRTTPRCLRRLSWRNDCAE
jgi:hypothetical protein